MVDHLRFIIDDVLSIFQEFLLWLLFKIIVINCWYIHNNNKRINVPFFVSNISIVMGNPDRYFHNTPHDFWTTQRVIFDNKMINNRYSGWNVFLLLIYPSGCSKYRKKHTSDICEICKQRIFLKLYTISTLKTTY